MHHGSFSEPKTDPVLFSPSLLSLGCHVCRGCSSPTERDPATTPDPPSPRQRTDSQLYGPPHAQVQDSVCQRQTPNTAAQVHTKYVTASVNQAPEWVQTDKHAQIYTHIFFLLFKCMKMCQPFLKSLAEKSFT